MDRRAFLRCGAACGLSAFAGCVGGTILSSGGSTVVGIETSYPLLSGVVYDVDAKEVDDSEREPVPFEDLTRGSRVELANGIHRHVYWSKDPSIISEKSDQSVISYRGRAFEPSVGVGDIPRTSYGPENDPDWIDPVDLAAEVADGELTVALTNELDVDLPVHHFGRPCFGVLVAVGDTVAVLDHDRYADNDYVQTSGLVTTGGFRVNELRTETLASGESLTESYSVPDRIPSESTTYVSLWIGDGSIEQFRTSRTVLAGSITLAA